MTNSTPYNHREIEPKWQAAWEASQAFLTPALDDPRPKQYILDMFPYPSGSGLHVGHLIGYTGSDVIARTARHLGKAVLHPIGWDAFGLPAENFAIKSGVHPAISTAKNTLEYRRQLTQAGMSYDWEREINSSSPEYYKWTQWLFQFLYKRGLAYKKAGLVNWCPSCQTVLANEQVVGGHCERCGTEVSQRNLEQWYFKITDYAERLLTDLEGLDWPEKIKAMQRNWIGKSKGASVPFVIEGSSHGIEVFTTRADTLFGATFLVIAPEHTLLTEIVPAEHQEIVKAYQEEVGRHTELERTFTDREKTGVFTGAFAINPATKQRIPIWTADYVLATYGSGAVMGVPAHDERDYLFAQKFGLEIRQVIAGEEAVPFSTHGILVDSGEFTGRSSKEVTAAIAISVGGKETITYRLRDWLVSRQRFWGAPIPVRYTQDGTEELVPEDQLPIELPMDVQFMPTGQSPLAVAAAWNTYIDGGQTYRREVDTLDTFVCSSWYFLRFTNPHYTEGAFDPESVKHWLPVDMYIGGAEHAVLHLLYARFITKVFFDAGLISFNEPFHSLRNQGMILGPDHNKMSKSKGNVINPNDVIAQYGADTLRVYELFMGPFDIEKPWNTSGIAGARRFLERIWKLRTNLIDSPSSAEEGYIIHPLHAKVTLDISRCSFNTAIAAMMEAINDLTALPTLSKSTYRTLLLLLNPFAPHITEEIWYELGEKGLCSLAEWSEPDLAYMTRAESDYAIQIDGKVRAKITVARDISDTDLLARVKAIPTVQERIIDRIIIREVIVPDRLVSLVTAIADQQ